MTELRAWLRPRLERLATRLIKVTAKVLVLMIMVPFTVVLSVKMITEWARKRREQRMILRELKRRGLGWLPMVLAPRVKSSRWRRGRNG